MKHLHVLNSRFAILSGMVLLAASLEIGAHAQTASENNSSGIYSSEASSFENKVRGLVRSSARVELRSDIIAPIAKVHFLEGKAFSKGDTLIEFDCSKYKAEIAAAKASANAAWLDHRSKKRLLKHGAIGKDEVGLAGAKALEASAQLDVQKARNMHCDFQAPFSGRVVELNSHEHEFPRKDLPIMIIINDSALEVEMVIPSNWLTWIEVGARFKFHIDETGEKASGMLNSIGAEVDPVSQTIKVSASLESVGKKILAGMSGTAVFEGGS